MGPTLFGHPLHDPPLSEGQKILLAVATSLALQDGSQENLILLLDEPEKHLHPKALLELLNHLDKACPHAQIWIATHSVHVLAHYGEKAIWSVRDGKAQHAGREWSSVLESLIGSSEHSDRVRSFLGLPAEHAMLSFAAECLIPPAVVDTEAGDPQTTQIAEFLKGVRSEGKPMRVLDFGAGQGRLLGELMAQSQNFAQDFDYFAYDQADVKDEHKARCLSRLSECYSSNGMSHYLSGTGSIRNNLNPKSVDCLILCNVLHEVDPKDWISLLGSNGEIYECLADHGVLLIVEDQLLRDGERAHTYNFLVLSEPELKALFGASPESQDIMSKAHPKYPDRLKIHRVPKRLLAQVTADTRAAALRKLVSNAQINAHALKGGRDAANGRLYGFWAMQHFNATEALADMSG
jgi:energy-coupling factor transporter ATP-binding protein EcfA2